MKNLKNKLSTWIVVLLCGTTTLCGCSDDDKDLPYIGTDAHLISLTLSTPDGTSYTAAITDSTITVRVPGYVSLEKAKADYQLCEQTTILPDPAEITDWSEEQLFRLISYNGNVENYTFKIIYEDIHTEGSITLTTQADVKAFAETGSNEIEGNLIIGSSAIEDDPVVSLSALKSLTRVKGAVIILPSFAGSNLAGLENVTEAGAILVGNQENNIMTPINFELGFPALEKIGDIIINSNSVQSLLLPALMRTSKIYVNSTNMAEINLSELVSCSGDIQIGFSGNKNTNIEQLTCPKLARVDGNLLLQYMTDVKTISLPALKEIGGNISYISLDVLEAVEAPELTEIGGTLQIESVLKATRMLFPKLITAGTFNINSKSGWSANDCSFEEMDFSSLTKVTGNFSFIPKATNLSTVNFPALENIGGTVTFQNLTGMESLQLPVLSVAGGITLSNLAVLEQVNLPKLASTAKLSLDIPNLKEILLPAITECGGIELSSLKLVEEFRFPETFTSFSGTLKITNCEKLAKIYGPSEYLGQITITTGRTEGSPIPEFVAATGDGLVCLKDFSLTTSNRPGDVEVKGIKTISGIYKHTASGSELFKLSLPDLEEINTISMSYAYYIESLYAPKLTKMTGDMTFVMLKKLKEINMPALREIQGTLSITGNAWNENTALTNLNGLTSLKHAGSIKISNCKVLTDFSGLLGVIPTLDAANWSVTENAYNPTYEDMTNGKSVQE